MMNQHTTASTCDTYRSAEATSRCGIARNQFTSGRQFAIRSGGSKANAAGYGPPIARMDHLPGRTDPTGDRTRLARRSSTYSFNGSQCLPHERRRLPYRNALFAGRTDLPRVVRARADVRACLPGGELRSDHLQVPERKWKVHPAPYVLVLPVLVEHRLRAQHARPALRPVRQLVKIKYRLHNSVRVVVRHVVAARDESVVNQTSEPRTVGLDALWHHHRILRRVQNDRRNGDLRLGRQLSLDLAIYRIARRQTIPMPIRVDHHIHELRVVEGQRGPIEILGWERTARSPFPPQLRRQLTPVASQTGAAPRAMKVVLIPGAAFLQWQRWLGEGRNVLNLV